MTITAKVIADSIGEHSPRLTTLQLRYPRIVHSEFMTHRVFSRNASSSRAVPVSRLIQDVMDDPYIPIHWGKNQKGMQADGECSEPVCVFSSPVGDDEFASNKEAWLYARDNAVMMAGAFSDAGYHKQIVNRLIEPFSHINVVVSTTDWNNFFALRCHPDAQPEMCALAEAIFLAMVNSTPSVLKPGEWHLPYVSEADTAHLAFLSDRIQTAIKCSVARCARVSYMTHEGKVPTIEADLNLYEQLVGAKPLHASPAEHQATPDHLWAGDCAERSILSGNFAAGWIQHRKTLPNECS